MGFAYANPGAGIVLGIQNVLKSSELHNPVNPFFKEALDF